MRKIIGIVSFIMVCSCVAKAQYVNIPDASFRNFLQAQYPGCFNSAHQMDTFCTASLNLTYISIFNSLNYGEIHNIDGIQYFKSLPSLIIRLATTLDTIPQLPPSLKYFECPYSNVIGLPPLPPNLETLIFNYSYRLTHLPSFPNSLKRLELNYCPLIDSIPPTANTSLEYFSCFYDNGSLRSPLIVLPTLPNTLKYLNVGGHFDLTSLPRLETTVLDTLIFSSCTIQTLFAVPQTLKFLNCSFNPLNQFPPLPDGLQHLECTGIGNYQDTSINILLPNPLPTGLNFLDCGLNHLRSLPSLPNSLILLNAYGNSITSLPPLPHLLESLNIENNPIHSIPTFPVSLLEIRCSNDSLSSLPDLPPFLQHLYCDQNKLTSLPSLPNSLQTLRCQSNKLTYLPPLPNSLRYLYCFRNDIYCLPKLPEGTEVLELQIDSKIMCLPNYRRHYITAIDGPPNGIPYTGQYPLCNPANNSNNCQSFPVMQGVVYYDNNSNGIKDVNEPVKMNGEILLSNGSFGFTNNSGLYEIGADSIGAYSLTLSAPRYYYVLPAAANYNFNTYDTLVTKNFALQSNMTIDELAIRIIPINGRARPGFSFPYLISYENTGTTTLSSNILFDYDQTKLNYNTSSEAGVVDNVDNLTYNTGALVPGQSGSFIGYFTLKTTVPLGDTLNAKAIISANTFTAYDSVQTNVRGAFDPNDKQATPQLSPSQVANGEYIDYTIRFQNTGTDTAFNIVVSDTLSEDLQAGSLQMLVSSHSCKATVKDNIVFFEFLNILLPDSNVNEPKSHGFVSFRIKPQSTVAVNTVIPNKAAIYFDYNAPVITNTAGTLIKEFTVVPLRLISFSAVPQTDHTTTLYWNTANEINTKHFVIEQSNDAIRFNSLSTIVAKGNANNNYSSSINEFNSSIIYYRLKIVDNDGSFTYSPIIKIDRRKNAAGFAVLTNPVKDFIIINTTDRSLNNTSGSIINSNGAVVKSFVITQGSQTIETKNLSAGIYYLRTANGSSRILIQR